MSVASQSEFRAGLVIILPATLAVIPFALIFGAAAAQKGLTPLDVGAMSALVFAGSAQFVAVDMWSDPAPWLGLAFATLLVNLRYVLLTASIADKLKHFPRAWQMFIVFFMADESWAAAERRATEHTLTAPFLLGMIPVFYLNWQIWSVAGAYIGSALQDPRAWGLDFAFTAIFIGIVAGFWKGPRTGFVMAASGVVAALVYRLIDGPWYVIAGALAGMAIAALRPTEGEPA